VVNQNDQIDVALNSFLASRALSSPSNKLSSEGQALVADVREVVKQAKHLLPAKRHGEQALDGLRTLGTLLITNGQFRKLRK
jgi:DNA ligase-4